MVDRKERVQALIEQQTVLQQQIGDTELLATYNMLSQAAAENPQSLVDAVIQTNLSKEYAAWQSQENEKFESIKKKLSKDMKIAVGGAVGSGVAGTGAAAYALKNMTLGKRSALSFVAGFASSMLAGGALLYKTVKGMAKEEAEQQKQVDPFLLKLAQRQLEVFKSNDLPIPGVARVVDDSTRNAMPVRTDHRQRLEAERAGPQQNGVPAR